MVTYVFVEKSNIESLFHNQKHHERDLRKEKDELPVYSYPNYNQQPRRETKSKKKNVRHQL